MFSYRGFSLLQSEHPLFLYFPGLFSKYFLLKLRVLDMIHTTIKNYLETSPKIGKRVGIHFYENVVSEMKLLLLVTNRVIFCKKLDMKKLMIVLKKLIEEFSRSTKF